MAAKVKVKRGRTVSWADTSKDVTLEAGQIGVEYCDDGLVKMKVGTPEVSNWSDLPYIGEGLVKLSSSVSSTAKDIAATSSAVKSAYDLAKSNKPSVAIYDDPPDLNDQSKISIATSGFAIFYHYITTSPGGSVSSLHYPAPSAGFLETFNIQDNMTFYFIHRYTCTDDDYLGQIYVRRGVIPPTSGSVVWSEWKRD